MGRAARRGWRIYGRPLQVAGWSISAAAIGLAIVRNLFSLEGAARYGWSIGALLLVTALYGVSAWLYRRACFVWFSGITLLGAWTILISRGWYIWPAPDHLVDGEFWYAYSFGWALLALLALAVGIGLSRRRATRPYGLPAQVLAHILLPVAILVSLANPRAATVAPGLGLLFYLAAACADRWQGPAPNSLRRSRSLYPAALLAPAWAAALLAYYGRGVERTSYSLLLLCFALPALFLGRFLQRRERFYGLPLYLLSYGAAVLGTVLVVHEQPWLIVALLFDTLLLAVTTWMFRQPLCIYLASTALGSALLLQMDRWAPVRSFGWSLIALAALYLAVAYLLEHLTGRWAQACERVAGYATAILRSGLVLVVAGLALSLQEYLAAVVSFGVAAVLYLLISRWKRWPALFAVATGLAAAAFWSGLGYFEAPRADYGLALWPGIAAALALAHWLDRHWGYEPVVYDEAAPPEPEWLAVRQVANWWALPLYVVGYLGTLLSVALCLVWSDDPGRLALALLLAGAAYGVATYRFRRRYWLVAAVLMGQLSAWAAIHWIGWTSEPAWAALLFSPVMWATALAGLIVERRHGEGTPLAQWPQMSAGWSRPLYLLVPLDLLVLQCAALQLNEVSAVVTLSNTLLLALLASVWAAPALSYVVTIGGATAMAQLLAWQRVPVTTWAWAPALLAVSYGVGGYLIRFLRRDRTGPEWLKIWDLPLRIGGWVLSVASLLWALVQGTDVIRQSFRAPFNLQLPAPEDQPRVQMMVIVLAVIGLFYLAAALADRIRWLGYLATAMLLAGWNLEWLLVWNMREVQWYVIPAGVYLLAMGYLEWRYGSRKVARWIDIAAMVLLLLSTFAQAQQVFTLGEIGRAWLHTLILGIEGLALLGWGIARRTRRFFYTGMAGVLLFAVSPLLRPTFQVNWIILGVIGVVLLCLVVWIERQRERVKKWSQEVRVRLETWE